MNEKYPYRIKVYGCIRPETYKYFLSEDQVALVWSRLEKRYGQLQTNDFFRCQEIQGEIFLIRAVLGGNPITIIQTRDCLPEDWDELHHLLEYGKKS